MVQLLATCEYIDTVIPIDPIPIDTIPIDTVIVDPTVNVLLLAFPEIRFFPNPVVDIATLALDTEVMGEISVELISISGNRAGFYRFIKSSNRQNFNLHLSNLAPGSYICLVSGHGFSERISFVKPN